MLRERDLMFTHEEICGAAHVNLVSLLVTATQFAAAQGAGVDAFWHFIGEKFAAGWRGMPRGDVEQVAQRIAHNLASCGAEVERFDSSADKAKLVITGYPPEWALERYGASAAEAHCRENLAGLMPISFRTLNTRAFMPIAS